MPTTAFQRAIIAAPSKSVAIAIVWKRFFESVDDAKINLLYAS